jgi:hypothetical protein
MLKQRDLDGNIVKLKGKKVVQEATKTSIREAGRIARDNLMNILRKMAERLNDVNKQEDYKPIIKDLIQLKKTKDMLALESWFKIDGSFCNQTVIDVRKALLKLAKTAMALSPKEFKWEKWEKLKPDYHETYYFTCCCSTVSSRQWAFVSTRGRVLCLKHFKAKFGNAKVKNTDLKLPKFDEEMPENTWLEKIKIGVGVIKNSLKLSDQLIAINRFKRTANKVLQEDWKATSHTAFDKTIEVLKIQLAKQTS